MKSITKTTLLLATILLVAFTSAYAQRTITGTVYKNGKPAAGIMVKVHRGGSMMTSFDGQYKLEASSKSKYIKFTYLKDTKKLDIKNNPKNHFDFAFEGKLPSEGGNSDDKQKVSTKTLQELNAEQNKDFLNALSLYTEFYRQGNYESARPYWEKVYKYYPNSTANIYIHGANMYEQQIKDAKTKEEKEKILDDYMKMYDRRIKYMGKEGFVLGRKGTAYLKYKLNSNEDEELSDEELKNSLNKSYKWLNRSFELQGDDTETAVLILLMQSTRSLFKLGELPKEVVVSNYDKVNSTLNNIISNSNDENLVAKAQKAQPYIERIFGSSGAADCETLVKMYEGQYNEKSSDIDFLKLMLRRLGRADCKDSELFSRATEQLYKLDPSAEAAFNMARRFLKKGEKEKAVEYYLQAMDQETDQDLLKDYYYEYGAVLLSMNKFSEARSYARKALSIDPNFCDANMLIGDIYASASRSFSNDSFQRSAIFWLITDYYNKARRGEDCAIDAAQKAAKYRRYFPNKEEAFMNNIKTGQTYRIGGWINENTKVRF